MKKQFCSPQELAEILGMTDRGVVKWIDEGKINAKRFGRRWRIPINEAVRFLGYNPWEAQGSTEDQTSFDALPALLPIGT